MRPKDRMEPASLHGARARIKTDDGGADPAVVVQRAASPIGAEAVGRVVAGAA